MAADRISPTLAPPIIAGGHHIPRPHMYAKADAAIVLVQANMMRRMFESVAAVR